MAAKKGLEELTLLSDRRYDPEHAWALVKGEEVLIGISDFAQDQLGEIVYIELPNVGDTFAKGDVFGQAESVKSVNALYIPVSGEVVAVNESLSDLPDTVNKSPYEGGWMIAVKPNDISEFDELLTNQDYLNFLKESEG